MLSELARIRANDKTSLLSQISMLFTTPFLLPPISIDGFEVGFIQV
jgi:hypothetical protein